MTYKWDTSQLQQMIKKMNKAKDEVQAAKTAYNLAQESLKLGMEGETYNAFMERMDTDMRNLDILMDAYEKQSNVVQTVIMKCYQPCEGTIKSKLTKLESNFK